MSEASIIFIYNSMNEITIQCRKEEKMKDICLRYSTKLGKNINKLIFLYGGTQLNFELSFEKQANSKDKISNEMKVLVYYNEEDEFICPKCGEKIELNKEKIDEIIKSYNDIKDTIYGVKLNLDNIINNSAFNAMNIQLKNINIILKSITEDINKSNEKLKNLLKDNIIKNDISKKNIIRGNINSNEINNNIQSKKNEINIIYKTEDEGEQKIFGDAFVRNNKNNIELIINGEKNELIGMYNLEKGINKVILIIKNNLTNLEFMFYHCETLYNIDELKYLDTSSCSNFKGMFYYTNISNIKFLENWDVSNVINFSQMFESCSYISDIKPLENWDVSKGTDFSDMFFSYCSKISDIKPLENWDVSKGTDFSHMFTGLKISSISPLQNWNVSNAKRFNRMFSNCGQLSDIKALKNWNISNGTDFNGLFCNCKQLSDIKSIENWDVSKSIDFSAMFIHCSHLSDIKPLKNWNVSNCNNFSQMFEGCSNLSDIKQLEYWNISKGDNFEQMFKDCSKSLDKRLLEKWKLLNKNIKDNII